MCILAHVVYPRNLAWLRCRDAFLFWALDVLQGTIPFLSELTICFLVQKPSGGRGRPIGQAGKCPSGCAQKKHLTLPGSGNS